MVDEKTGRVVEGENKGRGYELSRGTYVEIEPDELEAVEVQSTRDRQELMALPVTGGQYGRLETFSLFRPIRP